MAKHQRNCWVLLIIGDAPMAMLSIGIVSIIIMLISITITTATDALSAAFWPVFIHSILARL